MISSDQLRAARSLVGKTQAEVSAAAGVSVPTVKRAEGEGSISASERATVAIAQALERFGVVFLDSDIFAGPGVRWKRSRQEGSSASLANPDASRDR